MKKLIKITSVLCLLILGAFTLNGDGYEPGDDASDFNLKDISDTMVTLADYKDAKGFIVTFTCNHCPFAVKYEDRIIALNNKYKTKGYPVIAINPNDSIQYPSDAFSKMKVRAQEKGFNFPYLHDESQAVAKSYGALKTPHIYILKKEKKKLKVKYVGAIDDNYKDASKVKKKYAENALDELLAGKKVSVKKTKAIGCGIKWKK